MRPMLLLAAGLLLAGFSLPAQSLLLVDGGGSTRLLDAATLRPLGLLGQDELALCASADGQGLWVSLAGHPREIALRSLSLPAQAQNPLTLPGELLPRAWAADAAHARLWLAYESLTPQGSLEHGLALVDLAAATLAAFARVEGVPQALCLLPPSGGQPEQLLLAIALPGSEQGALLALEPGLGRVLRSVDLAGKPESLRALDLPALANALPEPTLGSPAGAPAAALPASPVAETKANSPTARGFKSPFQALRGCFFGQVRDVSGTALGGARLRAINRRGQALEAVAGDDGQYRLGPLSFGSYQVNAEKPGYRERILGEQILLENARQLDLVLEPAEP